MRFTIRSFMIAVVVVAVLLAGLGGNGWLLTEILDAIQESGWPLLTVFSFFSLDFFGAQWLVVRGLRRTTAASFWVLAILANALYVTCCIAPSVRVYQALRIGWFLILLPTMIGLVWAWAMLATRAAAVPRRAVPAVWFSVFILALLPIVTLTSCWPLRLAFLAARPTLARLADRVEAEKPVSFPQQAGIFRVVDSGIGPVAGNVALVIDSDPNGRNCGFVRIGPGIVAGAKLGAPIAGLHLDINLGGRWSYRGDD